MKTDEFGLAETVAALSAVMGVAIASAPAAQKAQFVSRLRSLIANSEPDTIRWRVYRHVLRDVLGGMGVPPERF